MNRPHLAIALLALSAGCAREPAQPPAAAPPPAAPTTDTAAVAQAKLLCARIALVTSAQPSRSMPLTEAGSEGAHADVFVSGDMKRVVAEVLGETSRQQLDYRFADRRLVCALETWTTMQTVLGESADGPPAMWRMDFRVWSAGKLVHSTFDEAPGVDEQHRTAEETVAFASELLTRTAD